MPETTPNMSDYEEAFRDHRLEVPEFFNFGFDVVDGWAEDRTKLALISVDPTGQTARQHTFWDLKVQSNRFANVLADLDVGKGDRVLVMLPRIPEWYVVLLGLIKLGAVPVPTTTLCTSRDIEYRINEADANLAITDLENAAKLDEAAGNCPSLRTLLTVDGSKRGWVAYEERMAVASSHLDAPVRTRSVDPLLIYFTSGTVGYPKMVLHTQASYGLGHILTAKFWHDLKPTDLQWTLSDTGWAKAAYGKLFGQWHQGAAVLQHDARGRFDAGLTLGLSLIHI